jgi:hypothetical protein
VNGLVKTCSTCSGATSIKKTECSSDADTVCVECLANLDCDGDGQLCNTRNECKGCSAETSGSKCNFKFNLIYNPQVYPIDKEGKCMSKTENNVEVYFCGCYTIDNCRDTTSCGTCLLAGTSFGLCDDS